MSGTRHLIVKEVAMTKDLTNKSKKGDMDRRSGEKKGEAVMFEQLVEVGPRQEGKEEEGRDGMLDRSVTGCNYRLLIGLSTDQVLSIWKQTHPQLWVSRG